MKFDGFDWDRGNWPKCAKHGLTKIAIETVLRGDITLFDSSSGPDLEKRYCAIGEDAAGRPVLIVFCLRHRDGKTLLRPISARYMRDKEVRHYARQKEERS